MSILEIGEGGRMSYQNVILQQPFLIKMARLWARGTLAIYSSKRSRHSSKQHQADDDAKIHFILFDNGYFC